MPPPRSRAAADRIVVCRDKDPYPTLAQYIDDEFIPKSYGGSGPDPDPTGQSRVVAMERMVAMRAEVKSEKELLAKVVADSGGNGFDWSVLVHNGYAPYFPGGTVPVECYGSPPDLSDYTAQTIKGGNRHNIEVDVQVEGGIISWDFMTKKGEISFRMTYTPPDGSEGAVDLVPLKKLTDCHRFPESGGHTCEKTGLYTLIFDNSANSFTSKELYYKLDLSRPEKKKKKKKKSTSSLTEAGGGGK